MKRTILTGRLETRLTDNGQATDAAFQPWRGAAGIKTSVIQALLTLKSLHY